MRISQEDQWSDDIDWFGVDEEGRLAHFASAGYKLVPKSVASSAEDLHAASTYLLSQSERRCLYFISETLSKYRPHFKGEPNEERYLRSFIHSAERGLYSYDIASHLNRDAETFYFLVAKPETPLLLSDLPSEIQAIVGRTRLAGTRLREIDLLPHSATIDF